MRAEKRFTPLLEVFLEGVCLLKKETWGCAGHDLVAALVVFLHHFAEGFPIYLTCNMGGHPLNQILAVPVKALEAVLTQNLLVIRPTGRHSVATAGHL